MGKAMHDLVQEHDKILHAMELLRKIQEKGTLSEEARLKYYGELAFFLEVYADKCHHGKEENNMYHTLAPLGDEAEKALIIKLIEEHVEARALVRDINKAVAAGNAADAAKSAARYRTLLLEHIRRENDEMFPSLEKRITDQQQDVMFDHFLKVEDRTLGEGNKERIDAMFASWENELLGS